jgi:hypothetical protein
MVPAGAAPEPSPEPVIDEQETRPKSVAEAAMNTRAERMVTPGDYPGRRP